VWFSTEETIYVHQQSNLTRQALWPAISRKKGVGEVAPMKFKLITKISLGITGIVLVFSTAPGYTFVKGTNPGSHISMTRVKK